MSDVDPDKAGLDLRTESQMLREIEKLLIGVAEQLDRMEDKMGDGRWL
jgi:hypothetical protein